MTHNALTLTEHLLETGIYHPDRRTLFTSISQPDSNGHTEADLDDGTQALLLIGDSHDTIGTPEMLRLAWAAGEHRQPIAVGYAFGTDNYLARRCGVMRAIAAPELAQGEHLALDPKDLGLFIEVSDPDITAETDEDGKWTIRVSAPVYPVMQWIIDTDYHHPVMRAHHFYEPLAKTSWLRQWQAKSLKRHRIAPDRIAPEIAALTASLESIPFEPGGNVVVKTADIYGNESFKLFTSSATSEDTHGTSARLGE